MSDAVVSGEGGSAAGDTPAPASTDASLGGPPAPAEIPVEAPSPVSDPRPAETPVTPEPPVEAPKPAESPVIAPSPVENPTKNSAPYDEGFSPEDVLAPASPQPPAAAAAPPLISIKDRAYAALEKIRFNKRKKLDKIVVLAQKKRSIKNDDVEKLLKVSDSTAQRYLNQLVAEAKLRRVGHQNQPTYEPL